MVSMGDGAAGWKRLSTGPLAAYEGRTPDPHRRAHRGERRGRRHGSGELLLAPGPALVAAGSTASGGRAQQARLPRLLAWSARCALRPGGGQPRPDAHLAGRDDGGGLLRGHARRRRPGDRHHPRSPPTAGEDPPASPRSDGLVRACLPGFRCGRPICRGGVLVYPVPPAQRRGDPARSIGFAVSRGRSAVVEGGSGGVRVVLATVDLILRYGGKEVPRILMSRGRSDDPSPSTSARPDYGTEIPHDPCRRWNAAVELATGPPSNGTT